MRNSRGFCSRCEYDFDIPTSIVLGFTFQIVEQYLDTESRKILIVSNRLRDSLEAEWEEFHECLTSVTMEFFPLTWN